MNATKKYGVDTGDSCVFPQHEHDSARWHPDFFGVTDATACFVINVVFVAAKGAWVPLQDTWCGLGELVHRAQYTW